MLENFLAALQSIAADLKARYGEHLASLRDQATVPSKAIVFPNSVGTAPSLIFNQEGKCLILMPGIPQEMQPMFEGQILPYLQEHFKSKNKIHHAIFQIFGISLGFGQ